MAILPIYILGDPALHTQAKEVTSFDDDLRTLVADMFETMAAAPGVGLAAPQVGVSQRVFVYSWNEDDGHEHRGVAINPTLWLSPLAISPLDDDEEAEGCLSFPGERFPLRRAEQVILQAVDLEGKPFEIRADGWLARIFQHEYDHLDGVLYVDRLEYLFAKQAQKISRKNSWGVPGRNWLPGRDHPEG